MPRNAQAIPIRNRRRRRRTTIRAHIDKRNVPVHVVTARTRRRTTVHVRGKHRMNLAVLIWVRTHHHRLGPLILDICQVLRNNTRTNRPRIRRPDIVVLVLPHVRRRHLTRRQRLRKNTHRKRQHAKHHRNEERAQTNARTSQSEKISHAPPNKATSTQTPMTVPLFAALAEHTKKGAEAPKTLTGPHEST